MTRKGFRDVLSSRVIRRRTHAAGVTSLVVLLLFPKSNQFFCGFSDIAMSYKENNLFFWFELC